MRRFSQKKNQEDTEINLTPMLDVVFIMLIFFIVTSEFKKNETILNLTLPNSSSLEKVVKNKASIIEISVNNIAYKTKKLDFIEEDYTYDATPPTNHYKDTDYVSSSVIPYINFNNTDDYYVPREGFKIGSSLEYAGVGGNSQFIKSSSYLKYFYSNKN